MKTTTRNDLSHRSPHTEVRSSILRTFSPNRRRSFDLAFLPSFALLYRLLEHFLLLATTCQLHPHARTHRTPMDTNTVAATSSAAESNALPPVVVPSSSLESQPTPATPTSTPISYSSILKRLQSDAVPTWAPTGLFNNFEWDAVPTEVPNAPNAVPIETSAAASTEIPNAVDAVADTTSELMCVADITSPCFLLFCRLDLAHLRTGPTVT
jgi:hypothetical protein